MATQSAKLVLLGASLWRLSWRSAAGPLLWLRLSASERHPLAVAESGGWQLESRMTALDLCHLSAADFLARPFRAVRRIRGCYRPTGESAVGKSSLVLRFVRDEFSDFRESTIGACSSLGMLRAAFLRSCPTRWLMASHPLVRRQAPPS